MATFAGSFAGITGVSNSDTEARVSVNLATFTVPLSLGTPHVETTASGTGPASPFRGAPAITTRFVGVAQPGFGSDALGPALDWFERFFVIFDGADFGRLGVRDLGYLLSNQQMNFELWNTDRTLPHTLLSLTPAGPSGVTWNDPYGLPLVFRALQSRLYDVDVRLAGAPQIQNFLVVEFDTLTGPEPTVQGLRVIPIPFTPNWGDGFQEGSVYRTDIMVSDDGSEQRARRRYLPRHHIRYNIVPENDRELQLLDQLLYGWSKYAFGIPLWCDARRLTGTVSLGDTTIPVATTQRRFLTNGNVLLVADAFTWEAAHVQVVDPAFLEVEDQLQHDWLVDRTWVVPLYFGRLPADLPVERPSGALALFTVDALCDPPGI